MRTVRCSGRLGGREWSAQGVYTSPCGQNDRRLWKRILSATDVKYPTPIIRNAESHHKLFNLVVPVTDLHEFSTGFGNKVTFRKRLRTRETTSQRLTD